MSDTKQAIFNHRRIHISEQNIDGDHMPAARMEISGRFIAYDPEFSCVHYLNNDGDRIGIAIGFPYHAGHGYPQHNREIRLDSACQTLEDAENAILPGFAGPSVLILYGRSNPTLYLSPGGEMPIVYDPQAKRAGSTTELLLNDQQYAERFDQALHHACIGVGGSEGWIIGDNTAHTGIKRLLPNHALDLVTWQAHRHWPKSASDIGWIAGDDVISEICKSMAEFCTASSQKFNLFVGLTAGVDTRLVLAACKNVKNNINTFTIHLPTSSTALLDTTVAKNVADGMGLKYRLLESVSGTAEQGEAWDRAVGHSTMHPNRLTHCTLFQFPEDATIASGLFGEVGCGWPYELEPLEINNRRIDARQVALRLKSPDDPLVVAAVERWLAPLQGYPSSVILDLAYWELRMGGWSCGQRPAQGAIRAHITPIAQRPILEYFVRLKPEEKADDAFVIRCLYNLWPELQKWPFNKFGDYRDWITPLRKLTSPGRLKRYLRTRRAGLMARSQ